MNTPTKLGGFGAVLVTALAVSLGVGNVVSPINQDPVDHSGMDMPGDDGMDMSAEDHNGMDMTAEGTGTDPESLPGGLMVSQSGYTIELAAPTLAAGRTAVEFTIAGPDGEPVTDFEETHEKDLHLIVVRRDTTGFQHVHPTMDAEGLWSTEVDLTPGDWRFFADFQPVALEEGLTLGVDASVSGPYDPRPLPAESRTAEVDGYTVTLDGDLAVGESNELTLTVTRDGSPVTDLQPYLGAYGHLVALRAGDLAYLHVHPDGEPGDGATEPGPDVVFYATVPSAGGYRLYLDFQHDGVVRTAEFTVGTTGAAASPEAEAPTTTAAADDDHSGH